MMRWDAIAKLVWFDASRSTQALLRSVLAFGAVALFVVLNNRRDPMSWLTFPLVVVFASIFMVPGVAMQDRTNGTTTYVRTLPFSRLELATARTLVLAAAILIGSNIAALLAAIIVRVGLLGWPIAALFGATTLITMLFLPVSMLLTVLHSKASPIVSFSTFGLLSASVYSLSTKVHSFSGIAWTSLIPRTSTDAIIYACVVWSLWLLVTGVLFNVLGRTLQKASNPHLDALRALASPSLP